MLFAALLLLVISSCAPVLRKDLIQAGTRDFPFADLTRNPELYRGKLFILGGTIGNTTVTERGSLIEALYVPVDSSGYLRDLRPDGRFLALYPKEQGILDPVVFGIGRRVTLAATFTGTRPGKIGQMGYVFPSFRIEQVYLWPQLRYTPYYDYYRGPYGGPPWAIP